MKDMAALGLFLVAVATIAGAVLLYNGVLFATLWHL